MFHVEHVRPVEPFGKDATMSGQSNPSHAHSRPRLGRGLSSMIVNSLSPEDEATYSRVTGLAPVAHADQSDDGSEKIRQIEPDKIRPNPYQPRR